MPNATVPASGELPVPGDLRRRAAPPRPIGQKGRDRLVGRFSPCLSPSKITPPIERPAQDPVRDEPTRDGPIRDEPAGEA
jgi:hypothetical protein